MANDPLTNIETKAEELAREERRKTPLAERFARVGLLLKTCGQLLAKKPEPPEQIIGNAAARGEKVEVIAPAKLGKSWFAIMLACCLATGRDFLGLVIPKAVKVLYVNLELSAIQFAVRLWRVREALGLLDENLCNENLYVLNARSQGLDVREQLVDLVADSGFDVVILDTRYKLQAPNESENSPEGLAGVLEFQDLLAECGVVTICVGHDRKGIVGDIQLVDRGAGSNWASRDFDTRWVLTPSDQDPEKMAVWSSMSRNNPKQPDKTIRFTDKCIWELTDVPAIPRTSHSPRMNRKTPPASSHGQTVHDVLEQAGKPLPKCVVVEQVREKTGIGEKAARLAVDAAVASGIVRQTERQHERNGAKLIGTPEQLDIFDYIHEQEEAEQGK